MSRSIVYGTKPMKWNVTIKSNETFKTTMKWLSQCNNQVNDNVTINWNVSINWNVTNKWNATIKSNVTTKQNVATIET